MQKYIHWVHYIHDIYMVRKYNYIFLDAWGMDKLNVEWNGENTDKMWDCGDLSYWFKRGLVCKCYGHFPRFFNLRF